MYCWCDMCGYNAKVNSKEDYEELLVQVKCPDCSGANYPSYLCADLEFPEHIAEDDPMPTYSRIACSLTDQDKKEGS